MESKVLGAVGKVAGIGGLALGVFLLIFQGLLKQNLLFQAGLSQQQAFYTIAALMILTFGIAGIGIFSWLISARNPDQPMPHSSIIALIILFLLVIGAAVYLLSLAAREPPPPPQKMTYKICMGNGGGANCMSGADAYFDCNFYRSVGAAVMPRQSFSASAFARSTRTAKCVSSITA
jgi:hypothetical protein